MPNVRIQLPHTMSPNSLRSILVDDPASPTSTALEKDLLPKDSTHQWMSRHGAAGLSSDANRRRSSPWSRIRRRATSIPSINYVYEQRPLVAYQSAPMQLGSRIVKTIHAMEDAFKSIEISL